MAIFALVGFTIFLLVAFGWRTWLQYRLTGDFGMRSMSGSGWARAASLFLLFGVVSAFLSPVLELAGLLSPAESFDFPLVHAAGALLVALGFIITVTSQIQMGTSWRIGVDSDETTTLITGGISQHVRNPIYSGTVCALCGLVFLLPNLLSLLGVLFVTLGLEIQVRRIEEPHLVRKHGELYVEYARIAGRFIPGLGRFHSA